MRVDRGELCASPGAFHTGNRVDLRGTACAITTRAMHQDATAIGGFDHCGGHVWPRRTTAASSHAAVLLPRTEIAGVADAMIKARITTFTLANVLVACTP